MADEIKTTPASKGLEMDRSVETDSKSKFETPWGAMEAPNSDDQFYKVSFCRLPLGLLLLIWHI